MKDRDRKTLWAKSGNICSFPGCDIVLVQEQQARVVVGVEAHIKGERPGAARYDPNQSDDERDSYDNRILLCATHHTVIDGDEATWTVEKLHRVKDDHETQVALHRFFPRLLQGMRELISPFEGYSLETSTVSETVGAQVGSKTVRVDASKEEGVSTGLRVEPGQKIRFFARGLVGYDGHNYATPEGILCNEYGMPYVVTINDQTVVHAVWPHADAYKTNGGESGRIGSLYGWIGARTEDQAFFVGSKREVEVTEGGMLYLAVNDAKGTYADNDGEFRVDIQVVSDAEWR